MYIPTVEPQRVTTSPMRYYDALEGFIEFLIVVYCLWALFHFFYLIVCFVSWLHTQLLYVRNSHYTALPASRPSRHTTMQDIPLTNYPARTTQRSRSNTC